MKKFKSGGHFILKSGFEAYFFLCFNVSLMPQRNKFVRAESYLTCYSCNGLFWQNLFFCHDSIFNRIFKQEPQNKASGIDCETFSTTIRICISNFIFQYSEMRSINKQFKKHITQ